MDREADVCVVGAGYAGLTAARRLAQAGRSVVVLEARDRIGGRVWTEHLDDDTWLDIGGTWLGPTQPDIYALAAEVGVKTYPTFNDGDRIISINGTVKRFGGQAPSINPLALASLAQGMARLNRMAATLPIDEPWTAKRAGRWDSQTAAAWLSAPGHVPVALARDLLGAAVRGLFTSDPAEVSLLHVLYLIRSAGKLETLLAVEGGYQQDRVVGGAQAVADRMAAELGDAVVLGCPVRRIRQNGVGVEVAGDTTSVRAAHAVVAVPPALAAKIDFDPPLPQDRRLLHERMPAGSVLKALLVYDEPFWRRDGLTGESAAVGSPIESTFDASPESGRPGILAAFAFGPHARILSRLAPDELRRTVLDAVADRFGPKAATPVHARLHDWADEEWSRGCYLGRFGPGLLTQLGPALRRPCGRIHWAGTETATTSHGTIDGAVRSGQRAAAEILRA